MLDGQLKPIERINGKYILAAGPLAKQAGNLPFRIVLVGLPNKGYAVYSQTFDDEEGEGETTFAEGNYFRSSELVEAVERFGLRVSNNAENLRSLYRDGMAMMAGS